MQAPPPFEQSYQPPQKGKISPWIYVLGGIGVFCCLGIVGIGALGVGAMKSIGPMVGCSLNMYQAQKAMFAYADAHDGKLPSAETWQDDIAQYYSTELSSRKSGKGMAQVGIKIAPITDALPCNEANPKTGIFFNSDFAGKKITDAKDPGRSWILYEDVNPVMNGNAPWKPKSDATAPMIMGSRRQWLKLSLNKASDPLASGSDATESGPGPAPKPSDPPADSVPSS